jgi:pyruvate dehydrogenase (quinone)
MANALAQAIGAQAVDRGRQVISLSGDGGFSMSMGDLLTLRQLDLHVKVVIVDNGELGFVALEQKAGGFLDVNVKYDNPDFAEIAKASGIFGIAVTEADALEDALRQAFAHDGPAVVAVKTAPQELAMPPRSSWPRPRASASICSRPFLTVAAMKSSSWRGPICCDGGRDGELFAYGERA